jgi:hypothetical protein
LDSWFSIICHHPNLSYLNGHIAGMSLLALSFHRNLPKYKA